MLKFEYRGKKKIRCIFLILLLIGLINIVGITIKIQNVKATLKELQTSIIADKDTSADQTSPDSIMYGITPWLIVGNSYESYLHFDFSGYNTNQAEVVLDITLYLGDTFNTSVCLVEEYWNETSLSWSNRPSKGPYITNLIINSSGEYRINVTEYVAGKTNISICLYPNMTFPSGFFEISAREQTNGLPNFKPYIFLTYLEDAQLTVTSPTSSSVWSPANNYTITWTSIGTINNVRIELYKGATFDETIATNTENDGAYQYYVYRFKKLKGTDYQIKVIDIDEPNVYAYSNFFIIIWPPATIEVTNPTNSSSWELGKSYPIRWTSTGPVSNILIEPYKGDARVEAMSQITSDTGEYLWAIPNYTEPGTDWRIKISNTANDSEYDWSDYFEIYRSEPRIPPAITGYKVELIFALYLNLVVVLAFLLKKKGLMKR